MADTTRLSDRLADEYATGSADVERASELPGIPPPGEDLASMQRSVRALKSVVDVLTGAAGSVLDKPPTVREMINEGVLAYSPSTGLSAGAVQYSLVAGGSPGGGSGVGSGDLYVDPRPVRAVPPTPQNLKVRGAFKNVLLVWELENYRNHAFVEVWRNTVDNLSTATLIGPALSNQYTDQASVVFGQTYWYWLRAVNDQGAVGAYTATTATSFGGLLQINGVDLAPLAVEAAALANGSVTAAKLATQAVDLTKFANGIEPITIVTSGPLPATKLTSTIFWTDGKLYRWNGTTYVSSIPAVDVTGTLTAGNIPANAIDITKFANGLEPVTILTTGPLPTIKATSAVFWTDGKLYRWSGTAYVAAVNSADLEGQLQSAQIATLAASKITGQLTDTQVAALSAAKLTGQITSTQITDGAVTTPKILAGAVTTASMTANTILGDRIAANTLDAGKITASSITTAQIAAGSIQADRLVANSITTAQITAGGINADRIAANSITAGQIQAGAVGAEQIAAGAITAKQLLVSDFENLCFNGRGNNGIDGWDGQVVQIQALASGAVFWPQSINSDSTLIFETRDTFFGPYFDVAPGDSFYASMDTMSFNAASSLATFSLGVVGFDKNNAVAEYKPIAVRPAGTAGHLFVSGTGAVTAGSVARARLWVQIDRPWESVPFTQPGAGHYATNIQVRRQNTGKLIVDGAITAVKIGAREITAGKIAVSTLTGNEIAANSVSADRLVSNSVTAGQIAAGAIGTAQLAAGAVTAGKLLVTGQGAALNDDPACSDITAWNANSSSATATISDGASGNSCLRITSQTYVGTRPFPVATGKQYRVSCFARKVSGTGTLHIRLEFLSASGAILQFSLSPLEQSPALENYTFTSSGWVRFRGTATAPAAAVLADIGVTANYQGNGVTELQDVRCEEYVGADLIVDGAIIAAKLSAGAVVAGKLAANAIVANDGVIGTAAIDNAMVASLSADKITFGTMSGERIDVGSMHGNRITFNTLNGDRIIANSIGAGQIDARGLTILDGNGVPILGSGYPLQALNASIALRNDQQLWSDVNGRPKLFRVVSRGASDTSSPIQFGFYNGESGASVYTGGRSYMLVKLNRASGAIEHYRQYDVYGSGASGGFTAATLAADLNATTGSQIAVVWTFDEPRLHRLDSALPAAMYRCGASRAVFGSPQWTERCAYILVGIGGCGEGNGYEAYSGSVDFDANAWCDVSFQLQNGQLLISGAGATPRTLADYSYVGDLNATNGATWALNIVGQPGDAALLNSQQQWVQVSGAGKPADNATVGAPAGTLVGGVDAATIAAQAAAGAAANSALASKLNKAGADTLTGPISLQASTAILVGDTTNGLYLGSSGMVGRKAGATTFAVQADGTAKFAGELDAASGTFAGALQAVTGTLGALTIAAGGNIKSGQTGYNTGGIGAWRGFEGGVYKESVGNPSGARMLWDGTDLYINTPTFEPFIASLSAGDIDVEYLTDTSGIGGTRSVSVVGGKAPYSYVWVLTPDNRLGGIGGLYVSNSRTASATFGVNLLPDHRGGAGSATATCFVRDASGRVTFAAISVSIYVHGATGGDGGDGGGGSGG